jgi:uncharacterized protein YbjT (DUF2867 family)
MDNADAVIHVAGLTNAPTRAAFEAGNVRGTAAIVDAARASGVRRFIHVSSLAARMPALSNYGWSKAKAEALVMASGLDWTIVRPPWVFGARDADTLELFKAARNGIVPLPRRGHVSVIEVGDLARLLLALIGADAALAQIYEPDDGREDWTNASFARAIGRTFNRRIQVVHLPKAALMAAAQADRLLRRDKARLSPDRVNYMTHRDWRVDPSRRPPADLWQPQSHTRAALRATLDWYRAAGWIS